MGKQNRPNKGSSSILTQTKKYCVHIFLPFYGTLPKLKTLVFLVRETPN